MVYEAPSLLCSAATRQTNDEEDLIPDSISEEVENVATNEISMDMDGYSMTEESRAALRHQDNNIITQEIERIIPIDGLRTKEEEIELQAMICRMDSRTRQTRDANDYEILGYMVKRCTSGETVKDTNMKVAMEWLNFYTQKDMQEGRGGNDDMHCYSIDKEYNYGNPPEEDECYSSYERDLEDYEDLYARIDTTFGLHQDTWKGDHHVWRKFRCFMCQQGVR
eukprot:gene32207-41748_t